MDYTNDMYTGITKLAKWYRKGNHQFIEISGVMGTGSKLMVNQFISDFAFDPREIMYLSYDQKEVLEMASKRIHAYYTDGLLYKYTRMVDFNSIPVINPQSTALEYQWVKSVRKKIDKKYKLIILTDSTLLNKNTLSDIGSLGLPVILMRDPALIPSTDSYTFTREPNIELKELHPELLKNPIVYFANKVLYGSKIDYGNYDNVSVVPLKQLNLYNLKSAQMTITISDELADTLNAVYRDKIMHNKSGVNTVGERLIVADNMYGHKLVNEDESHIKIYLRKGLVGTLVKCYKHAPIRKYVQVDFKPEFYHDSFTELMLDRNYLNGAETPSRQLTPDEIFRCKYAYALSVPMARLNHWDKVTLINDNAYEDSIQRRMLYTAISRCHSNLTLIT